MTTLLSKVKKVLGLKWLWITLLSVAAVAAIGVFSYKKYKKRQLEAVQLDMSSLAKVEKGTLENKFQENGDIWPKKSLNIYSQVSGRVVELPVGDGQTVRQGQTLAVIQRGTAAEKYVPSPIAAPIGGVLMRCPEDNNGGYGGSRTKKFIELDEYVSGRQDNPQGATCMMAIADMRSLIVKLSVNEVDILKFREKMPVDVTVDALPSEKFSGVVTVISKQAEEGNRESGKVFRTEVTLDKHDERLRIGMTGRVAAVMEKKESVLKVSLSGLFEEEGRTVAYIHVPNDKPRQIELKTGMRTPLEVEILSGIKEGDQVFTEKPVDFTPLPGGKAPAPASSSPRKR